MQMTGAVLWGVKCVGCEIVGESWVHIEDYPVTMAGGELPGKGPPFEDEGAHRWEGLGNGLGLE